MGTRSLLCVVKNGAYKVAQYSQFDGYPSGLGKDILNFLCKDYKPEVFAAQVDKVRQPNEEENYEINNSRDYKRIEEKYSQFSREFREKILSYVQETEQPIVQLATEFAADSLFCKWCYVIDLDKQVLEVYKGFNQEPLNENERFFFLTKISEEMVHRKKEDLYYPVKQVYSVPLEGIGMNSLDELMDG